MEGSVRRARGGEEHMSFGVPRGATGFSMRGIHILSAKHRPKPGDAARRIRKVGGKGRKRRKRHRIGKEEDGCEANQRQMN